MDKFLYFVILDFLDEKLEWRENREYTMDAVKSIKTRCLDNPEQYLWIKTKKIPEVKDIFYLIKQLNYGDKPDYNRIRQLLISIYEKSLPMYVQPSPKYDYLMK